MQVVSISNYSQPVTPVPSFSFLILAHVAQHVTGSMPFLRVYSNKQESARVGT